MDHPVSFVFESNQGGVPVSLCACGVLLYQPMAQEHTSTCVPLAAALQRKAEGADQ